MLNYYMVKVNSMVSSMVNSTVNSMVFMMFMVDIPNWIIRSRAKDPRSIGLQQIQETMGFREAVNHTLESSGNISNNIWPYHGKWE